MTHSRPWSCTQSSAMQCNNKMWLQSRLSSVPLLRTRPLRTWPLKPNTSTSATDKLGASTALPPAEIVFFGEFASCGLSLFHLGSGAFWTVSRLEDASPSECNETIQQQTGSDFNSCVSHASYQFRIQNRWKDAAVKAEEDKHLPFLAAILSVEVVVGACKTVHKSPPHQ